MQPCLTLDDALRAAQAAGLPRLDAQWLLLHALGRSLDERAWLLAHGNEALPPAAAGRLAALIQRRLEGEPLAYLVGQRGFYGLTLQVDARVLDPRPDTETLVDWALELQPPDAAIDVLDLGTGSGALALAVQAQRPHARVWAVDASLDALAVAAANGARLGLPVHWLHGDWWDGWRPYPAGTATEPPARWDLVLSNPPYLADDDPHWPTLRHEPPQALRAGPDGLAALRTIIAGAPARLHPGGWLLLEHGWDQADAVAALLRAHGFGAPVHRRDLGGHVRCTGAAWLG
ncbi:MAG: peptide chain release factor N(5)-glutamine methyltransferase [Tepidimonas sp.]|uniref:peptide chain release factor N(5)-glutamine methyltransferase n=1 Tax=Tepidimonas sp. TaxID=2002775 RepID=UPI00298F3B2F|nr:peptide chain release factor N(5)-glutamine methyltransferase [Tepidimonas sp.]MDW8336457.1 peptide chain release factor N(5)-glutamine methyltransferase [Tepidimonas sp.]